MIPAYFWLFAGLAAATVFLFMAFHTNGEMWEVGGYIARAVIAAGLGLLAFAVAMLS